MKSRCDNCKKKVLIRIECKCCMNFCLNCLPFDKHLCDFDYVLNKKEELRKDNPQIQAIKVSTI